MHLPSQSTSFTSEGTVQGDEGESHKTAAYAKSILAQARLSSPVTCSQDSDSDNVQALDPSSPKSRKPQFRRPRSILKTSTTSPVFKFPPTPEATPSKLTKRTHIEAFDDLTNPTTPSKQQRTNDAFTITPADSPSSKFTPARRNIFHNTPERSDFYKSPGTTAISRVPSTLSVPLSSRYATPQPAHLEKLLRDLEEPLPSDLPSPVLAPYDFRSATHTIPFPTVVFDQDESGTYTPSEHDERSTVTEEEMDNGDDEIQLISITKKKRTQPIQIDVPFSVIEMQRLKESVLEQVSGKKLKYDVASNRSERVYRRVLSELFDRRIEEMRGEGGVVVIEE